MIQDAINRLFSGLGLGLESSNSFLLVRDETEVMLERRCGDRASVCPAAAGPAKGVGAGAEGQRPMGRGQASREEEELSPGRSKKRMDYCSIPTKNLF